MVTIIKHFLADLISGSKCIHSGCDRPAKRLDHGWLCERHYWRVRAGRR